MHFNDDLSKYITNNINNDYKVNLNDLTINKQRLIENITKTLFYR